MATILLTWELGGGLGHVARLRSLGQALSRSGHRVVAALRDLSRAHYLSEGTDILCLQAPLRIRPGVSDFKSPCSFAHILHNAGFGVAQELGSLVSAWQGIYDYVSPDAVVFDHSPTALLASAGRPLVRVLLGTGFCCPPAVDRFPNWRPQVCTDPVALAADEDRVRQNCNAVLRQAGSEELLNLADLYSRVDECLLTTFPELDHFADRAAAGYVGVWNDPPAAAALPRIEGRPQVFAYLKPFRDLSALMQNLARAEIQASIYVEGLGRALQETFRGSSLTFLEHPVDMAHALQNCQVALVHANHASTVKALLAARPVLLLPLYLEQQLLAQRVQKLGCGLMADPRDPKTCLAHLERLLTEPTFSRAADQFSRSHAQFDPTASLADAARRVERLLGSAPTAALSSTPAGEVALQPVCV